MTDDTYTALLDAYRVVLGVAEDVPRPERANLGDAARALGLDIEALGDWARHMATDNLDDVDYDELAGNFTNRIIISFLTGIQLERARSSVS